MNRFDWLTLASGLLIASPPRIWAMGVDVSPKFKLYEHLVVPPGCGHPKALPSNDLVTDGRVLELGVRELVKYVDISIDQFYTDLKQIESKAEFAFNEYRNLHYTELLPSARINSFKPGFEHEAKPYKEWSISRV